MDRPAEVSFTPAVPGQVPGPVQAGTGWLQPGGLVVHTGWHRPLAVEQGSAYRQGPASEGWQSWRISTPDGHEVACFRYYQRADAEQAASVIAAALPGGIWPADARGDTAMVSGSLYQQAFDASTGPDLLPHTDSKGRPDWGYGAEWITWRLPPTRALYERMIAKHGGSAPATCLSCRESTRRARRADWLPRTGHWPRWGSRAHPPGTERRAHCHCEACLEFVTIGALGEATDEQGQTVPGAWSSCTLSPIRDNGREVALAVRPFTWFSRALTENGHVIMDNRPCVGLWPRGVRHDDAFLCETGIVGDSDFAQ
ncbi:hypothetical protein [Streptomyces sp. NPDC000229]|uniref:hypothetical protein n=1 Tax=Streptomyces sp. NPDC000229 TaxID=3154247 RepID=UPI003326F986